MSLSITQASFGPDDHPTVYADRLGKDRASLTIVAGLRNLQLAGGLFMLRQLIVEMDRQLTRLAHDQEDESDG